MNQIKLFDNHRLGSFKAEATPLLEVVTKDIYLESIWLSVMSMLENVAAEYILSNITEQTPTEELRNIIKHVKDEQRHANVLSQISPVKFYPESKYYSLHEEWKEIGREFIMSFFNSPELRLANHRYAAYVHGAQTIERLPFRIYSLYLSLTRLPKAHQILPAVIDDEKGHIEFGQKMYANLLPEEKMPLSDLYKLEENISLIFMRKMNNSLLKFLNDNSVEDAHNFEKELINNRLMEVAWNYSLTQVENLFDKKRSDSIAAANTLARALFRGNEGYRQLEKKLTELLLQYIRKAKAFGVSESAIQYQLNRHYNDMIYKSNSVALHYAYFCILENQIVEDVNIHELKLVQELWNELLLNLSQVNQYESSVSVSGA